MGGLAKYLLTTAVAIEGFSFHRQKGVLDNHHAAHHIPISFIQVKNTLAVKNKLTSNNKLALKTKAETGATLKTLLQSKAEAASEAKAKTGAKTGEQEDVDQETLNEFMEDRVTLVTGRVTVGTPPQEFLVAFDVGSSELILPSTACKSGPCISHKMYDPKFSITSKPIYRKAANGRDVQVQLGRSFGLHGDIAADVFEDKVCFSADLCLNTPLLATTMEASEPFGLLPYDGILGLGIPGANALMDFPGYSNPDIFGALIQKRVFQNDRFALYFSDPFLSDASDPAEQSKITLGGFDANKLASKMYWFPIARNDKWSLKVDDIYAAFTGQGLEKAQHKKTQICGDTGCTAILDSSSPLFVMPKKIVDDIKAIIGVSDTELADCQPLHARPPKLKKIGFMFNGIIFYLDPNDYVDQTGACMYRFQPLPQNDKQDAKKIFLGVPFLRKFYTVFDRDSLKIGLALANHGSVRGDAHELIIDQDFSGAETEEESTNESDEENLAEMVEPPAKATDAVVPETSF